MAAFLTNIFDPTNLETPQELNDGDQPTQARSFDNAAEDDANPDDTGGGASRGDLDGPVESPQSGTEPVDSDFNIA